MTTATSLVSNQNSTRPPSLQQIADACGVSKATVSLALRNRGKLASETRERIRNFAERLGYREKYRQWLPEEPKAAPLPSIGSYVVVPVNRKVENTESFQTTFMEHIRGLTEGLNAADIPIKLFWFEDAAHEFSEMQDLIAQGNIRGLVNFSLNPETTRLLWEHNVPMVTNSQTILEKGVPTVLADSIGAYQQAWEYVGKLGHSRTAYLGGAAAKPSRHYFECLAGAGLAGRPGLLDEYISLSDIESLSGIMEILEAKWGVWRAGAWPTLLFTQNDFIACRVIQALQQRGLRVPEDISVIGHDDTPAAVCSHPAITTLRKPRYEIGLCLAQMLIGLIRGDFVAAHQTQVLPMSLIVRQSCSSPIYS